MIFSDLFCLLIPDYINPNSGPVVKQMRTFIVNRFLMGNYQSKMEHTHQADEMKMEHMDHSKMQHGHDPHHGMSEDDHHAMMIADFKKRFYVVFLLTVPILLLSMQIQQWLHVDFSFTGSPYVFLH